MSNLIVNPNTQLVSAIDPSPTVSVLWDRAIQQAVIADSPGPTVASRAYAMVHSAIFDAWAAYDPKAISTQLEDSLQRPEAEITADNKREAVSYAAYRTALELFPEQAEIFDALMSELGYDPANETTDTTTPAGVGNVSAEALLKFRRDDGSNQLGDEPNGSGVPYSDTTDFETPNSTDEITNLDFWTPENVPIDDLTAPVQKFLTPQWGDVTPFALDSGAEFRPTVPEPFLLVDGTVDFDAKSIILADGSTLGIDRSLIGTVINPKFIEQTEQVVDFSANLSDKEKLIAEFWEDGGGTSFPPGTWMTFGQFVSARDEHTLDDDVKLFFGLGNAVFDAGIATWEAKTFYNYARPVRTIRALGELGLIGEFNSEFGGYAIESWQPGEGTKTILATDYLTYQTPGSDPSPPFAEYTSGHSAFSAAGAEILQLYTGSDEFGAEVSFEPGESRFEPNVTPEETVTLTWDTFSEAADEAGISRLYGGIHFEDGDLNGRVLGRQVGQTVFEQAQFYINGGVEIEPLNFEGENLAAGTIIKEQFANLTVSSDGQPVMIFDTANPTGGDTDLASDNFGNVLILSEDGDTSDPDDSAVGGRIFFDWNSPVNIDSIGLLDIESTGGSIAVYDNSDRLLQSYDTSHLTDDGGAARVDIGLRGVGKIELDLTSSGAVTDINFF
ncbi:MAG: vanadium-dependent haloperoxidase [Cyanobacteria bacterium J06600_6]